MFSIMAHVVEIFDDIANVRSTYELSGKLEKLKLATAGNRTIDLLLSWQRIASSKSPKNGQRFRKSHAALLRNVTFNT